MQNNSYWRILRYDIRNYDKNIIRLIYYQLLTEDVILNKKKH
jgi:hypothetical protein